MFSTHTVLTKHKIRISPCPDFNLPDPPFRATVPTPVRTPSLPSTRHTIDVGTFSFLFHFHWVLCSNISFMIFCLALQSGPSCRVLVWTCLGEDRSFVAPVRGRRPVLLSLTASGTPGRRNPFYRRLFLN